MSERKIKRALISVYDKTGIVNFARALVDEFNIEIISTGGTAKLLKENGIPVTLVEEITGFPEMLDGRVKTLHPRIHAAILADRDNADHMRQLKEQGIEPIDMVVVNLYPFENTVADPACTFDQAIEMIDIGGPCLLRAAAKNHKHVIPVGHIRTYDYVVDELKGDGEIPATGRVCLASVAFETTSAYDDHVDGYLTQRWTALRAALSPDEMRLLERFGLGPGEEKELIPEAFDVAHVRLRKTRYGENPHQIGALTREMRATDECSLIVSGSLTEDASYNNYADAHAALELCKELTRGMGRAKILFAQQQTANDTREGKRFDPITEDILTRRKLPHWQIPGATYWVTFGSAVGDLSPEERDIVMAAIRHWNGQKLDLHAAAVMPDHVHVLLTPRKVPGQGDERFNLSALLQSIKAHSGRRIAERRGGIKQVWVRESFDRWIRSESDFEEKYRYIANNPVKEGLADTPEGYRWWYGVEAMPWDPRFETPSDTDPPRESDKEDLCPPRSKENPSSPPICVFIKHTNACGVGIAGDPVDAYRQAYLGDPNAAMGGILACNFRIDAEFAATVMDTYAKWGKQAGAGGFFAEVWIAPEFAEDAVDHIRKAKAWGERVRLLSVGDMAEPPNADEREYKSITGGMLVQSRDLVGLNEDEWKVATKRQPTESELSDLRLAWLVAKHTKSNAVSICKDGMLIGNGAGQMSRVMSCRIATWLAKENGHADKLKGSAAASDAFFPFPDGPNILIDAGVTAIIQPGGSKRDEDTIAACNERNVAMIFTGTRHFKH